ncbi:hypothetical protein ACIRBX_03470 [Kitasatospora sp. NPDC096147]|uniref:hypothetical protein n=1 Tax=Kitasatospora sp. NPDC096147 TaxID=3364093 RepID=UPI0037F4BE12
MPHDHHLPSPAWDHVLADAFAVLLGRPLSDFDPDARYAVALSGNLVHEVGFHQDPVWVRPAALSGAEPVVSGLYLFDEAADAALFDAARSLFEFHPADGHEFPAGFAAAVEAVAFGDGMVLGADLAPLLGQFGVDLAEHPGSWTVAFLRQVSDGTLPDALRTALGTGRRPEDLPPFTGEPDEEWEEELDRIEDEDLRSHLGFFCTDGDTGLMPSDESLPKYLDALGFETVAAWEDGHGQLTIHVVRIGPEVAERTAMHSIPDHGTTTRDTSTTHGAPDHRTA